MSGQADPAAAAGHLSPDGYWWWDGTQWLPVAQPQPAAAPPAGAIGAPTPWLRIAAGSTALAGVVATLVASILPYGSFPDPSGGPTTTSSLFNGGFSGAGWDVPEPVLVILVGAVAATLVLIGINHTVQAVSLGLLLALGAQTSMMWTAYFGLAATDGTAQSGGIVGIVGAVLLFVAGLLVAVNLTRATAKPAP